MERRLLSCHRTVAAVDSHLEEPDASLTRLPCSAHYRPILSIHQSAKLHYAPGFGDWPGPLHNFACSGSPSPGFGAMIRHPAAQNLKSCAWYPTSHTREIVQYSDCGVLRSLSVHECIPDSISASPRQRSSPPGTYHTRRPACAGRAAAFARAIHCRLHASCHPLARTSTRA